MQQREEGDTPAHGTGISKPGEKPVYKSIAPPGESRHRTKVKAGRWSLSLIIQN
ncbi:MAG: hypothetical protein ACFFCW_06380 [Candidatus Hodarchaeota archaeon]